MARKLPALRSSKHAAATAAIIQRMPAPELVHPVPVEEIPAWTRAMASTFLGDPDGDGTARRIGLLTRDWEPERAWGAKAGGRFVATLRTDARSLTVPGAGTATNRRRGLLTQMLGESLTAARDRGDAASILIAAEWPIYGRFGYAPATLAANYVLRRGRPGATVAGDPSRLRQVERDEFAQLAPAVYERARRRRAGQLERDRRWWDRVLGGDGLEPSPDLPHNWLVHESADGPDGLLAWRETTGHFGLIPPYGRIDVWTLATATDAAYRDSWAYLSGIDVSDEIHLYNRPADEPARWLLHDARTLVMTEHVDFTWLRILDVPKALSARRYATSDELVLEISDDAKPSFVAGRYRLRDEEGTASCERTDAAPDLEITQTALASLYLGGFRLRQLAPESARESTPGALHRLDLMFSTSLAPWNATWF